MYSSKSPQSWLAIHKLRILALSYVDLTVPGGATRLILSSLGAMVLAGHRVVCLRLGASSYHSYCVKVTDGRSTGKIEVYEIPDGAVPSEAHITRALPATSIVGATVDDADPNVILCESRLLALLCKNLATRYRLPWILRCDAMRHLFQNEIFRDTRNLSELVKTPFALLWYKFWLAFTDLGICVSTAVEEKLRRLLVTNICTVESTFLLTVSRPRVKKLIPFDVPVVDGSSVVENLPDDLIMFTGYCSLNMLRLLQRIAKAMPETTIVTTSLLSQGIKNALARMSKRRVRLPSNVLFLNFLDDFSFTKLNSKLKLIVVPRPYLTGTSMAVLQALFFAKPCLTDSRGARTSRGLDNSGAVIVEDDYLKWPSLVRWLHHDDTLLREMNRKSKEYYRSHLAWKVHARFMEQAISKTFSMRNRKE